MKDEDHSILRCHVQFPSAYSWEQLSDCRNYGPDVLDDLSLQIGHRPPSSFTITNTSLDHFHTNYIGSQMKRERSPSPALDLSARAITSGTHLVSPLPPGLPEDKPKVHRCAHAAVRQDQEDARAEWPTANENDLSVRAQTRLVFRRLGLLVW